MKIESICCNQCGGPLKVPDSVNFVTCNHCDASLAIRREESVTFTERFENIAERTGTLETELRQLTIDNQLLAHEQQWEKDSKNYMIRNQHGGYSKPIEGRGDLGAAIVFVLGLISFILIYFTLLQPDNKHGYKAPEFYISTSLFGRDNESQEERMKREQHIKASTNYRNNVARYKKKKSKELLPIRIIMFVIIAAFVFFVAKVVRESMEMVYLTYQKAYQSYLKKQKAIQAGDHLPDSLKEA